MVDEKTKYLCKQQELVEALTDEMSELYRAHDAMESKLDSILSIITNDPDKVEEINKYLQACPRKDELDALSGGIKSWTEKIEKIDIELKECKDKFAENNNIILQVKDRFFEKIKKRCENLQAQIDELRMINNSTENSNNTSNFANSEKVKIKYRFPLLKVWPKRGQLNF